MTPDTHILKILADSSPANRRSVLIRFIVDRLSAALDLEDSDPIGPRSRFEELGVDSKRAVELKEDLEQEFQCSLRTTLLFDYPTPDSLAGYIIETIFGTDAAVQTPPPTISADDEHPNNDGDIVALMARKLEKYKM